MDMRVWIGCLACYNAGELVGKWYDATEAAEVTTEQLHADGGYRSVGLDSPDAARWSPDGDEPNVVFPDGPHEELWVMDHDGFGGLLDGECSPMEATRIAELAADLSEGEVPALGHFRSNQGGDLTDDLITEFRDAYVGFYDSEQDYAMQLADEMDLVPSEHSWPASYIDWESATRDLFMTDYWSADDSGGVYVFRTQ